MRLAVFCVDRREWTGLRISPRTGRREGERGNREIERCITTSTMSVKNA